MKKSFLVPVGVAAAALSPISTNATITIQPTNTKVDSKADQAVAQSGTKTHVMQFLKGDEKHELFMKKSEAGLLFAAHGSHASHGSHGSHRSGS